MLANRVYALRRVLHDHVDHPLLSVVDLPPDERHRVRMVKIAFNLLDRWQSGHRQQSRNAFLFVVWLKDEENLLSDDNESVEKFFVLEETYMSM